MSKDDFEAVVLGTVSGMSTSIVLLALGTSLWLALVAASMISFMGTMLFYTKW